MRCARSKPEMTSEEWWFVNEVMTSHLLYHETKIEKSASETVNDVEEEPDEKAMLLTRVRPSVLTLLLFISDLQS